MKLLFICTHNRCRSILAEAITKHVAGGEITAASAGSSPQSEVHPLSIAALERHCIETEGLRSQSWNEFEDFDADAIITLCDQAAAESCPVWFDSSVQVHWGLHDPSKSGNDDEFDKTIDILSRRIAALQRSPTEPVNSGQLRHRLQAIAEQIN